jgi:hypothetical protein
MTHAKSSVSALKKFIQPRSSKEQCELCGRELAPEHQHVLNTESRTLACSCDPCALLFESQAGARFRQVPRSGRILNNFQMTDDLWERLQTPIGLAFFVHETAAGCMMAHYPSPAGAISSDLPTTAWNELVAGNPALDSFTPDVEALLVNRTRENRIYLRAPIDTCYELIGIVRGRWRGLSGGSAVWEEIDRFFARARERWDG